MGLYDLWEPLCVNGVPQKSSYNKLMITILVTCTLVPVYYNVSNNFSNSFFYSRAIVKNQDLLPETPIINLLYDDFWGTPLTHSGSHKSYRPVCVLSFRLNYIISMKYCRKWHFIDVYNDHLYLVLVLLYFNHDLRNICVSKGIQIYLQQLHNQTNWIFQLEIVGYCCLMASGQFFHI
jgi:hypothetical protein